ncbi:MAG: hypothetical protein MZV70_45690 [Desulfobacterales bacterium]|nr:hypothetical protein [Desulfobacterales bacterium]
MEHSIDCSAPSIQAPRALPRMSAANRAPVPSGLVRISASPASRPLLRQSRSGTAVPLTVRPKAS